MVISENKVMNTMWNESINSEKGLSKDKITCGSGKKVFWICNRCSKIFEKTPNAVSTNLNRGEEPCPYCSGKKANEKNNLMYLLTEKVNEYWDFKENSKLGIYPENIKVNTNISAWFYCKKRNKKYMQKYLILQKDTRDAKYVMGKKPMKIII